MQHPDEAAVDLAQDMAAHCLGLRVAHTHRLVTRMFDQALRPHGLTRPQLELLSLLALLRRPARPSDLADLAAVERSTMSRNLAVLQDRGWVEPTGTSPTGRAMTVAITPAGTQVVGSLRSVWQDVQQRVLEALGPEAPSTFDQWIRALADRPARAGDDVDAP